MPAIRCAHCKLAFPIGSWDVVEWRKVPEFACPHCGRSTRVSVAASLLALLASLVLVAFLLLGLRSLMLRDGVLDGMETILFFAIGFAVAALASLGVFNLVHALFGTFVDGSAE